MTQKTTTSSGFIKLHRDILKWEWYGNRNVKDVFLHCLLKANYTDKKWQGTLIKRGSFITSYNTLATELGMGSKQIRGAIDKLEMTGEVARSSSHRNTLLTVNNYDKFQIVANQVADKGQASGKLVATTKKDKKEKKYITVENIKFSLINKDFIDDVFNFKKIVESANCLPSKPNYDSWATELRLLHKEVGEKRYLYALNWYSKNINKPYIPECYSAVSFRAKWDTIVSSIKRSNDNGN